MRIRLRQLHVDARPFTWRAEILHVGSSGQRCIRVRVWGAGKTGRALQADLLPAPTGAEAADDGAYPTADEVRAIVRHGLQLGWQPDERGGTFVLSGQNAAGFAVPGFTVAGSDLTAQIR